MDTFSATGPRLIVLDVSLPGTSVLDLCREIRDRSNSVSIFVASVRSDVNEIVQALKFGVHGCQTKPFSPLEFLARIRVEFRNRKVWGLDSL